MSKKKHSHRSPEPPERIFADASAGLTTEQAKLRTDAGYDNAPVNPPSKTVGDIIADNVFTYFNRISFGAMNHTIVVYAHHHRKYPYRYRAGAAL